MSKKHYYATTPIYYANGHPHLGNTYTTTVVDTLCRFYRFLGHETFFLTGTDEHGTKVAQAAEAQNKTPLEFTDEVSQLFQKTWKELGLEYSRFIRTTEAEHKKVVSSILQKIYDKEDIYFGEYGGNYCVGCERFLTDKELVDGKCPDHQTTPTYVKEENYFFKMSKYQDQLLEHIKKNPDFIRPKRYKNEVLAMLREPLEDLCISRPKSRLEWGIELPFDKNYVTYVWFDALINYLSGIDYPKGKLYKKFWHDCEHFIAKDILKPHGVFWPCMLLAAEIPLYKHLNVHGYWITPTGKMSKSLGNVVDPIAIKKEFGMDVFRYFVLRDMVFGLDGTFNQDSLETRYNADLANNLGNLVSRSIAMVHKYRSGKIPQAVKEEKEIQEAVQACIKEVTEHINKLEPQRALERLWMLIDTANVYIDRSKPWQLAKEAKDEELNTCLYTQLELLRCIAALLTAFMPETSKKILNVLGAEKDQNIDAARTWGKLKAGAKIKKAENLFPRLEKKISNNKEKKVEEKQEEVKEKLISFNDFMNVQLVVGEITEAERIEKSEKLIKTMVNLGEEKPRQIIAGIAKAYSAEELVGKKVVVVANLKPAKLMGQLSEGMMLAGSDDEGNLELVSPGEKLPPGSLVK